MNQVDLEVKDLEEVDILKKIRNVEEIGDLEEMQEIHDMLNSSNLNSLILVIKKKTCTNE